MADDAMTPDEPVTPEDFQPLGKGYPLESEDITGEKENHLVEQPNAYEFENTDEQGREVGARRVGQFTTPDSDDSAGEGWTLPTRSGGGWETPIETALEEQLDDVNEENTPQ